MTERLTPEKRALVAKLARESRLTYKQIGRRFNIPASLVSSIAAESGYRRRKPWDESEIAFLKENYQTRGARGCGMVLGRDYSVVSKKASELGLKTDVGPYGKMRVVRGGDDGQSV